MGAIDPRYRVGDLVLFANQESVVRQVDARTTPPRYYLETGAARLAMWIPEDQIRRAPAVGPPEVLFRRRVADLLVIDDFYHHPDAIRAIALAQEYKANEKAYKGKRTFERFLWPFLREEFERLLGGSIVDWLTQPVNGTFQITGHGDPLVWHSDPQSHAAAVYLTPGAPLGSGTSFWRDKKHGCRRPPDHPLEAARFRDAATRQVVADEVFEERNILHPDGWELVDRVGAVYNRLVLWDARLIHSATSYAGLDSGTAESARLVQLFFFTIA